MRTERRDLSVDAEDLVLYGLLVAIGVVPVVAALAERAVWGFDATLGAIMVALGVVGMLLQLTRARRRRGA